MQEVKYADYEVYVPKMSFLFNKKEIFDDVRKGISKKVRKDVIASARQYIKQYNEKQLVEAIPDDFVIKFEDSLASGNCQPGTEDWVNEHFPGKKSISAGELKKFKDNWNVMRVLRYVAQREGFSAKKINEIPAA